MEAAGQPPQWGEGHGDGEGEGDGGSGDGVQGDHDGPCQLWHQHALPDDAWPQLLPVSGEQQRGREYGTVYYHQTGHCWEPECLL